MAKITQALKVAIRGSGLTGYAIAKGSGVRHPALYRFLSNKQTLTLDSADKLAEFLGLELKAAARRPRQRKG